VPEVGRPPILRVGHERMEVFDHGIQIKTLEFLRVIELLIGSDSQCWYRTAGPPDSPPVAFVTEPVVERALGSVCVFP
jgi:hypothetical protein